MKVDYLQVMCLFTVWLLNVVVTISNLVIRLQSVDFSAVVTDEELRARVAQFFLTLIY